MVYEILPQTAHNATVIHSRLFARNEFNSTFISVSIRSRDSMVRCAIQRYQVSIVNRQNLANNFASEVWRVVI